MPWYYYVAYFFAGAFLANSVPHVVQGICGNTFQTPFASPPGVGESSATINVLWGWLNLVIGGGLLRYFFPPLPPPPGLCAAAPARSPAPCGWRVISARCATAPPTTHSGIKPKRCIMGLVARRPWFVVWGLPFAA